MSILPNSGRATSFSPSLCEKLADHALYVDSSVVITRNLTFNAPVQILSQCNVINLKIDAYSFIGINSNIVNANVGRYCSCGQNVQMGFGYHNIYAPSTSSSWIANPYVKFSHYSGTPLNPMQYDPISKTITNIVHIGHDVWVGAFALFPKNVTIGHGAVIGAGCIVTKDVPPYAVVVNGPKGSQIIKYRFSDEVISDLLEIEWWNYDIPKMLAQGIKVPATNTNDFIKFMKDVERETLIPLTIKWRYLQANGNPEVAKLTDVPHDFINPL